LDNEIVLTVLVEFYSSHLRSLYIYVPSQSSHEHCPGFNLDHYCSIHYRYVSDILFSPHIYNP